MPFALAYLLYKTLENERLGLCRAPLAKTCYMGYREGTIMNETASSIASQQLAEEPSLPHVHGSDTSLEAAESMRKQAPRDALRVLRFIEKNGGATCDEVELALGMSHQSASARVHDLGKLGRIVANGDKRPTRSGRRANVHIVTAVGIEYLGSAS